MFALGWLMFVFVLPAILAYLVFRGERANGAEKTTAYLWVVLPVAIVLGLAVLAYLVLFAQMGAALEGF